MKNYLFFLFLYTPILLFSQEKGKKKSLNTDITFTLGRTSANIRDFATSPLTYYGTGLYFSIGKKKYNDQYEKDLRLDYFSSSLVNITNRHTSISEIKTISALYSKQYKIEKWSNKKWSIKVGGEFNITGNLRINSSLQNNAVGIELTPTFFGTIKATKDISNKTVKHKKILFFKYKIPVKTRYLSYKLNVGLINSSYRNGYAYIGQSSVLNDTKVFDDYQLNIFSGFRIGSALDYTVILKNHNKIQFSYLWNAYKTAGDFDQFEMAQHTFKLSYLFNKKHQ